MNVEKFINEYQESCEDYFNELAETAKPIVHVVSERRSYKGRIDKSYMIDGVTLHTNNINGIIIYDLPITTKEGKLFNGIEFDKWKTRYSEELDYIRQIKNN